MKNRRDEGSIDLLPSGSYRVRYRVNGKRHPLPGTFTTEDAARKALRKVLTEIDAGTWWDESKGDIKFSEFSDEYLTYRRHELSPGTFRNYRSLLNRQLLPTFGNMAVGDIRVRNVDLWWASKSDHPVNRRNAYFLLCSMLNQARHWEYIKQSPCIREKAGKDVAAPRPTFAVADFKKVLVHVPEEFHTTLWVLLNGCLRVGELCGLCHGDYDLTTGILRVERQLSSVTHSDTPTKTGQKKEVPLYGEAQRRLSRYVEANPALPFMRLLNVNGKPVTARALRYHWERAREAAGLSEMHMHDLRHIGLTEWARLPGVTVKDIQARGGHASITAALRYQHTDNARAIELARMAEAMS